jgi:hypothetical protein
MVNRRFGPFEPYRGGPRGLLMGRWARALAVERPGVYLATVAHDKWCPCLRSPRLEDCSCDAEISLQRVD